MSTVRTFSRHFPAHHHKANQATFFVEKIYASLQELPQYDNFFSKFESEIDSMNGMKPYSTVKDFLNSLQLSRSYKPKHHTVRAGHHFKVGDTFSPRVWSGKPYASKQMIIAPDIEVKKVWNFEMDDYKILLNGHLFYHQHVSIWHEHMEELALNDGLTMGEMFNWFRMPSKFEGQIICWNDKVNYFNL